MKHIDATLGTKIGLSGEYRFLIREANGTIARDTGWMKNIITDYGLDRMHTQVAISTMSLGIGTTPVTNGAQTLELFSAKSDTSAPGGGFIPGQFDPPNSTAPYETSRINGYRFNIGTLNGTYSEVGVSSTNNGTFLFSRALIVDAFGNPSPITVLDTQQLDAFYRLNYRPPLIDTVDTFTVGSTTYTATGRAVGVGNSSTWQPARPIQLVNALSVHNSTAALGPITGFLSSAQSLSINSGYGTTPYVTGSLQRRSTVELSTAEGNMAGGIGGAVVFWDNNFGATAGFQYVFSPPIPKTSNDTLSLTFQIGWGRV
jgi:hypothetical protein